MSDRVAGGANVSVFGGSAILWVVPWPADGSVNDYIANFKYAIEKRLRVEDVYLIFADTMITAQSVLPEDLGQLVSVGFIICKSTVNFQRRRFY